jgi:hypothetical protein
MYRHLNRAEEAASANDVARSLSITRRDPLFASLAHARHAAILGLTGDRAAVQRAVGRAQDALDRAARDVSRPVWITAFYDQAELEGLAVSAYLSLGDFARAEAHAHRSLALLRPALHRTRVIATARLAHAQLGQGDLASASRDMRTNQAGRRSSATTQANQSATPTPTPLLPMTGGGPA